MCAILVVELLLYFLVTAGGLMPNDVCYYTCHYSEITWVQVQDKEHLISGAFLWGVTPLTSGFLAQGVSNMESIFHVMMIMHSQIAKFMGPTWDPTGSCQPQMGPMLAPWTLLSVFFLTKHLLKTASHKPMHEPCDASQASYVVPWTILVSSI